jgi:hypothetical protein
MEKDLKEIKIIEERMNDVLDKTSTIYWIRSKKYKTEKDILNILRYNIIKLGLYHDDNIDSISSMIKTEELYDLCIQSLDNIIEDAIQDRRREILLEGRI